ncbi:hypothetical protein [Streptomyces sp. NPDC008265]|uniref:hypothetical protein n=1 Tax=Streptomyces sp. NPDC008265 TaxID=3364824 RepID=UPI0036F1794F
MSLAEHRVWAERAIELSRKCPPTEGAFPLGAIILSADGEELANGYSREPDARVHAEESALAKLPADDPRLADVTRYSTPGSCSELRSRPLTCTQLIRRSLIPPGGRRVARPEPVARRLHGRRGATASWRRSR